MKIKDAIIDGTYRQESVTFKSVLNTLPASELEYITNFVKERSMAKALETDHYDQYRDDKMTVESNYAGWSY